MGARDANPNAKPRAYSAPVLVRYGPIARLTQTVGPRGKKDAKRSSRRTGFA
jgi:hypothetical protein